MSLSMWTKSFPNGLRRGFVNRAGFSKLPTSEAKTGICSVTVEQDLDVSVDKNVLPERIPERISKQGEVIEGAAMTRLRRRSKGGRVPPIE